MLGFVNLDYPLDLDDTSVASEMEALESWLQKIERKMASWEITEDKDKLAVVARNLTGRVKTAGKGKTWGNYEDFTRWARKVVSLELHSTDVEKQLANIVQARSFREYERRFRGIYKKNRQSLYPVSEQTVIAYFVQNMRNKHLQRLSSSQVFTSFDSLAQFAEDKIRSGEVNELYPSDYPEADPKPKTLPPKTLSPEILQPATLQSKTLQPKALQSNSSPPPASRALLGSSGRIRDHYSPQPDLFQDMKNKFKNARELSDDEDLILQPKSYSGERRLREDRDFRGERESLDEDDTPSQQDFPGEPVPRGNVTSDNNSDYDEIDYAWRKRMSPVLVDHPLDMYTYKHASEVDGVKAWLKVLSESIFMLDFRTHQEEVTFCIDNARGFVAEAIRRHGKFSCFVELKKWVQDIYGITDQKRDVVGHMIRSVQSSSLPHHIFRFRKFLLENDYCKYPVSPELISEIFVQNLRDIKLRSVLEPYLYQEEPADLQTLTELAEDMLVSGEIPNNYLDWETMEPPFNNGPPPPGVVERRRRNFANKSVKRKHPIVAQPRDPHLRNVRTKTDLSSTPGGSSTGTLSWPD
ncbi:hypothetical protein JCM33374_g1777 [Metschnikowia sp. JCM 33374]|nr:hypothetical protein JCM33374_g1777 [Metschnikowia sp. JCM 33374]